MPSRSSKKPAEEPCASGQSRASLNKDKAAQPRLFAAAAARKAGKTKTFNISAALSPSTTSPASSNTPKRDNKASWEIIRATYQKGEKQGKETGNVYMRAKPRFGQNAEFKERIKKHSNQQAKWNDDLKMYIAKMMSAVVAANCLEALRDLPGCAEDVDEDIDWEIFVGMKEPAVSIFPFEDGTAIHGAITYDFKDDLKDKGFNFVKNAQDKEGFNLWVSAEPFVDTDDLTTMFEKFGIEVNFFDSAE